MTQQLIETSLAELSALTASTVTTDPSSLFFSAVQLHPSDAKQVKIVISGVSSTAQTTITAPEFYEMFSSTNTPIKTLTVTGNVVVTLFVRFAGSGDVGIFDGLLTISGNEIATTIVSLATAVTPNPSIFPSSLFFSTIQGQPSLFLELDITVSSVSATAKTFVQAPNFYEVASSPDGIPGTAIVFTGNGVFKIFVRFSGSVNPGNFNDKILVTGDETISKTVPVKTTVLVTPTPTVNPVSLSGFTAVEDGAPSAVQSFDLSVKGLPTQGKPVITVTAPKGYSVGLSSNASSFVGAFVVFAQNGIINIKVFVRLNSNNPVGPVKGNVTITGTQVNTKNVPASGTITAKPQPTLAVDKTSLTGFSTITNKPSAVQSYSMQATNLPSNVTASVKAPTGYEVSLTNLSNSIFQSQVTVLQSAGSINAIVFVRLKSQTTPGNFTGVIENSVAGLTKNINVSGSVVLPPTVTINPTSLSGFTTVKNQASTSKTYSFVANNLSAGVNATITAPANYELRLQGSGAFFDSLTLAQNGIGTINQIIEVRLKATATTGTISGNIQHMIAGLIRTVSVSGTVSAPILGTTVSSLIFTAVKNQVSPPQSYKVLVSNLVTGLTATVTVSSGYEISLTSDGTFSSSLTLTENVSQGINTEVFVRLKASAKIGTITGTLQHLVAGLSKVINLSATVVAPLISVNPVTLTGFSTGQNQASQTKSYTFLATNLATGLKATVTAPAGYEIAVQGTSTFSNSLTLTQTSAGVINGVILVRLKSQATVGNIAGNVTNTVDGLSKTVALSGVVIAAVSLIN